MAANAPRDVIFSMRFTQAQRTEVAAQAKRLNLSDAEWIRTQLFSERALTAPLTAQQTLLLPYSRHQDFAKILYRLGQTRIANNLNQIAKQANMGTLVLSPDVERKIDEAYRMIQWIRETLIRAQGLKP